VVLLRNYRLAHVQYIAFVSFADSAAGSEARAPGATESRFAIGAQRAAAALASVRTQSEGQPVDEAQEEERRSY